MAKDGTQEDVMPHFSTQSKDMLSTCHPDLQRLFNEVIKHYDCKVICGYRDRAAQEAAYARRASTKHFPNSKHNTFPSVAVDVIFYPFKQSDWNNPEAFRHFNGFVEGVATMMGIKIRCGGDWDMDHDLQDQKFIDLPHYELVQ